MDYQSTLKYLYESVPMFQEVGGRAYKPGLETTHKLDEYFGHPHQQFKTIHIAGTNGKGSCSHTIAAVLQSAGYRVGLFTSPHLIDFRERIRINGEMISEEYVTQFVEEHRPFFEPLKPSFFELTTAMAFRYFADQKVDVAIIEVGMGGRLDCTNIITPDLCVITNIGFDHMQYLGDTLTKIAKEKAGIIKKGVPVVLGNVEGQVKRVFTMMAKKMEATIIYSIIRAKNHSVFLKPYSDLPKIREEYASIMESLNLFNENKDKIKDKIIEKSEKGSHLNETLDLLLENVLNPIDHIPVLDKLIDKRKDAIIITNTQFLLGLFFELTGGYQMDNALTILSALDELRKLEYKITKKDYLNGFGNVCELTGIMGRWQKMQNYPTLVCDTGHNADGFKIICQHFEHIHNTLNQNLHIVFGMASDKDVESVLQLLPKDATYYFTKASVKRALPEDELLKLAEKYDLKGNSYPTVPDAVRAAKANCPPKDFIFVGGSNFIVADLLMNRDALNLH